MAWVLGSDPEMPGEEICTEFRCESGGLTRFLWGRGFRRLPETPGVPPTYAIIIPGKGAGEWEVEPLLELRCQQCFFKGFGKKGKK